jgi:hypothetical protein
MATEGPNKIGAEREASELPRKQTLYWTAKERVEERTIATRAAFGQMSKQMFI